MARGQVPIAHAEEVEQVFDAISYCKGASVVRMLHAVLGHADFRKGLQLYMNRQAISLLKSAPSPLAAQTLYYTSPQC